MTEQIPSILVTLTVFNTSVAIYFNDLTRTKNTTLKSTKKHLKILKKHNKTLKKHFKIFFKNIKNMFLYFYKKHKKCFYIYDVHNQVRPRTPRISILDNRLTMSRPLCPILLLGL